MMDGRRSASSACSHPSPLAPHSPLCLLAPSPHPLLSSDQMCSLNSVKNNKTLAARAAHTRLMVQDGRVGIYSDSCVALQYKIHLTSLSVYAPDIRVMQVGVPSIMSTKWAHRNTVLKYIRDVLMLHGSFFSVKSHIKCWNSNDVDVCFVSYGPVSWSVLIVSCNSPQKLKLVYKLTS